MTAKAKVWNRSTSWNTRLQESPPMRCNPNLLTLGYEASFLCPVIPHGNSDAKKKKLASFLVFLKDLALQSSGTSRLASVGTPFWMIALFD
jgi:hypothetical protein